MPTLEALTDSLPAVIQALRAAGTDLTQVEVKSAAGGFSDKSVAPTISAFANTSGGILILGLDERRGFVPTIGFDAKRVANQAQERLRPHAGVNDTGKPLVEPLPDCQVTITQIDGASVVVIAVEELPPMRKPCYVATRGLHAGSYRRLADGDHQMSAYQVYQLSTLVEQPLDDLAPAKGAHASDLDSALVDRYLDRLRLTDSQVFKVSDSTANALVRLRILSEDGDTPTLAGLLALGAFPQQFFPQLSVAVSVFPGTNRGDIVEGVRLADRRNCDGPIPVMVEKAVNAVARNLRIRREMRGADAIDSLEIPAAALREGIANALLHRDYSQYALGQQVAVEVFPDRVEIKSPGGLWGGTRIADILRGISRSRNAALARILEDTPRLDAPNAVCENRGTGVPVMLNQMRASGRLLPRFSDNVDSFVVTLDRHGLLNPEADSWLRSVGANKLDRAGQLALAILHAERGLTRSTLQLQLGLDRAAAEEELTRLQRDGWIEPHQQPGGEFSQGPRLRTGGARPSRPAVGELGGRSAKSRNKILACFDGHEELTARQLTKASGLGISAVRRHLAALVAEGALVATAPLTSTSRAYRLAAPIGSGAVNDPAVQPTEPPPTWTRFEGDS